MIHKLRTKLHDLYRRSKLVALVREILGIRQRRRIEDDLKFIFRKIHSINPNLASIESYGITGFQFKHEKDHIKMIIISHSPGLIVGRKGANIQLIEKLFMDSISIQVKINVRGTEIWRTNTEFNRHGFRLHPDSIITLPKSSPSCKKKYSNSSIGHPSSSTSRITQR